MSQNRVDYLKSCMSEVGNMPLDQFNQAFCIRCQNSECVRSGANAFHFNKRVENWKETMFNSVPRAVDGDVKYDAIRAKRFLPSKSVVTTYGSRDRPEPPTAAMEPTKFRIEVPPEPAPSPAIIFVADGEVSSPVSVPHISGVSTVAGAPSIRPVLDLQNTSFEQGTILPGGEKIEDQSSVFVFEDDPSDQ